MPTRRLAFLRAVLLFLTIFGPAVHLAAAQTAGGDAAGYPNRVIKVIVPFAPGGGGDRLARTVVMPAAEALGQQMIVENRAGAGGNVGTEIGAKSPPDGYTLVYGTNGTFSINEALYAHTGFDPIKDFVPITRLTQIAAILVVSPKMPVESAKDLLGYLRAHPGNVTFGSAGNGTTSHIAGELFKQMSGVDIVHVPYRGNGPAMIDLMAGQVNMMIDVMPSAYPHVNAGALRALAVTTAARLPTLPDLPTLSEAGVPGYEVTAWDGIWAPAGTPRPIVDKLNATFRKVLSDPEVRQRLVAVGAEPSPGTPEELGRHVARELEKWAVVVRKSGAHID